MPSLPRRDDLSPYLFHLTRHYQDTRPPQNLRRILATRCIEARNVHCLVAPKINSVIYSDVLEAKFRSVCFTETPFRHLPQLVRKIPGRQIELRPFGLVFRREWLQERGGNPAVYLNSGMCKESLADFAEKFDGVRTFRELRQAKGEARARAICKQFALVNRMDDRYDFSWEREWRHVGNLNFDYDDLVAIIAPSPTFVEMMPPGPMRLALRRVPVIDVHATTDDLIARLSEVQRSKVRIFLPRKTSA